MCDIFSFTLSSYLLGQDAGQEHESRRVPKKVWSKAEVAAVMQHFRCHICKGKLATKNKCSHCKLVEGPALAQRTVKIYGTLSETENNWKKTETETEAINPQGSIVYVVVGQ